MSSFAPVERFVRDVLPTVPGGFQRVTDTTGHLQLITQAALARGLTPKTVGGTLYFYDRRWPVGGMTGWVPTLVAGSAVTVGRSKSLSKEMFRAAGVPTPDGISLGPDHFDVALAHVRTSGRPSVLKPARAKGGAGITCGITTEDDLRAAWETAELAAGPAPSYVLEDQVEGIDVRAYVIGHRVVAAVTRVHAHVAGDGSHTIAELVAAKRELRVQNASLRSLPIVVDTDLLGRGGRTINDVLGDGEVVVLNGMANEHVGGESVDVTDLVHPDLMDLAVEATRAIPGLGVAGIDLVAPSLDSASGAVVLEANIGANIRVHHTPAYGASRDVAGALIDAMIQTSHARSSV